jgi:hypothetical protein
LGHFQKPFLHPAEIYCLLWQSLAVIGWRASSDRRMAVYKSNNLLEGFSTEPEVADQLNKSVRTLRAWRKRGNGPTWTQAGATILYRNDAISTWLKTQERPTQSKNAACNDDVALRHAGASHD